MVGPERGWNTHSGRDESLQVCATAEGRGKANLTSCKYEIEPLEGMIEDLTRLIINMVGQLRTLRQVLGRAGVFTVNRKAISRGNVQVVGLIPQSQRVQVSQRGR